MTTERNTKSTRGRKTKRLSVVSAVAGPVADRIGSRPVVSAGFVLIGYQLTGYFVS